ncbi:N-acetylmuramoyl-L-alanine amidase [Aquimarina algiphila]|nr:N-acetylmuramoyl-L-alanine amidase [Aquimarina algiphila]
MGQGVKQKQANHHVTRTQKNIGAVLVEIGFITNPTQESAFQNDSYLESIGISIANGIFNTAFPNPTPNIPSVDSSLEGYQ